MGAIIKLGYHEIDTTEETARTIDTELNKSPAWARCHRRGLPNLYDSPEIVLYQQTNWSSTSEQPFYASIVYQPKA